MLSYHMMSVPPQYPVEDCIAGPAITGLARPLGSDVPASVIDAATSCLDSLQPSTARIILSGQEGDCATKPAHTEPIYGTLFTQVRSVLGNIAMCFYISKFVLRFRPYSGC